MADLDDDLDADPGTGDPGLPAAGDPGDAMVRFIRSRPPAAPRTSGQSSLPVAAVACLAILLIAAVAGAVVLRRDSRRAGERLRALEARLVDVEARLRDLEQRSAAQHRAAAAPRAAHSRRLPVVRDAVATVTRDDHAPLPTRPWVPIRWPARPLADPGGAPRPPEPAPPIGAGARDGTEAATVPTEPAEPGAGPGPVFRR